MKMLNCLSKLCHNGFLPKTHCSILLFFFTFSFSFSVYGFDLLFDLCFTEKMLVSLHGEVLFAYSFTQEI